VRQTSKLGGGDIYGEREIRELKMTSNHRKKEREREEEERKSMMQMS